jgi:hypothetical protein
MEDLISNSKNVLFHIEKLLTNLQELHFSKLLQFFNSKNMNDLEVRFLEYCVKCFLEEQKEELLKSKEKFDNKNDFNYLLEISFIEYITEFEKKYNKEFRRGNKWKK